MFRVKKSAFVLFLSFFISNLRCDDRASIQATNTNRSLRDAIRRARFYKIASAIRQGANPNCLIDGQPALIKAIGLLAKVIEESDFVLSYERSDVLLLVLGLIVCIVSMKFFIDIALLTRVIIVSTVLVELPIGLLAFFSSPFCILTPIVIGRSIPNQISISSRYKVVENLLQVDGLNIDEADAQGRTVSSIVADYGSRGGAVAHYMRFIKNLLEKRPLLLESSLV